MNTTEKIEQNIDGVTNKLQDVTGNTIDTSQFQYYLDALRDWAIDFTPKLVGAIIVFWIGFKIANKFSKLIEKILGNRDIDLTAKKFLVNLLKYTLKLLVVLAAIGILGVQTSSFVALFAAAGFAIGSALSGSLSNFANGIIILIFKPYGIGDWVEIDGIGGTVTDVNIFSTKLRTLDTREVVIPNSNAIGNKVINFSKYRSRMLEIEIGISYNDNIDTARDTLLSIVDQDDRIDKGELVVDNKPKVLVKNLGDNAVILGLRVWTTKDDYIAVKFELIEQIKKTFDETGLNFPFPQSDVHIIGKLD